MNDADLGAQTPAGVAYEGTNKWTVPFYAASVCAVLSILFALWYFADTSKLNKQVADLERLSATKDQEIKTNNALPSVNGLAKSTVEERAKELTTTVSTFRTLLDGRKVWSKVVPILSAHTLQGVTLTGMSIDDKLAIKIDGTARAGTLGSDAVTAYGLIARQVVTYQEAKESIVASDGKSVNEPTFSNVTLGSISQSTASATSGSESGTVLGRFSISATLNASLIKTISASPTTTKEKLTP